MATGINYLDEAWNVITGCTHAGSPGCDNCYAKAEHDRRHRAFLAGKKVAPQYAKPFSKIQFHPDRLDQPLHWRKPRDIGVVFGGDWMHPDVKEREAIAILDVMSRGVCAHHRFFTLTKRPERLASLPGGDYQNNTFHGATICNQEEADAKIPELLKVPGKLWVSIEPMLGDMNITKYVSRKIHSINCRDALPSPATGHVIGTDACTCRWLDWVAVGVESGPNRRPCKLADILSIVEQCAAAHVPCWVKQVPVPKAPGGEELVLLARLNWQSWDIAEWVRRWDAACEKHGWRVSHDMAEWPEALRVRQKP